MPHSTVSKFIRETAEVLPTRAICIGGNYRGSGRVWRHAARDGRWLFYGFEFAPLPILLLPYRSVRFSTRKNNLSHLEKRNLDSEIPIRALFDFGRAFPSPFGGHWPVADLLSCRQREIRISGDNDHGYFITRLSLATLLPGVPRSRNADGFSSRGEAHTCSSHNIRLGSKRNTDAPPQARDAILRERRLINSPPTVPESFLTRIESY